MAGLIFPGMWYLEEPITHDVWFHIGGYSVSLPHLRFDDHKTLRNRSKINFDLVSCPRSWPKELVYYCTFGNLPKGQTTIPWNSAERFKELIKAFPGWPSKLIFPSGIEFHGIVQNVIEAEMDWCKVNIQFEFYITDEFFVGGKMTTE